MFKEGPTLRQASWKGAQDSCDSNRRRSWKPAWPPLSLCSEDEAAAEREPRAPVWPYLETQVLEPGGSRLRDGGRQEARGERAEWGCVEMDFRRKRHLGAGEEERRALELLDRSYSIWKALDGMGSPMR